MVAAEIRGIRVLMCVSAPRSRLCTKHRHRRDKTRILKLANNVVYGLRSPDQESAISCRFSQVHRPLDQQDAG